MSKFTRWIEARHARQHAAWFAPTAWAMKEAAEGSSEPLGATKGDPGTPESPDATEARWWGVGVDVPWTREDECAHTALSLIYLRERDDARDEVIKYRRQRDEAMVKISRLDDYAHEAELRWGRLQEASDAKDATIRRRTNVAVQIEGMLEDAEGTIELLRAEIDQDFADYTKALAERDAALIRIIDRVAAKPKPRGE
jgi:hypothetical protein